MALGEYSVSTAYSVVIATCDREESLARVLGDWAAQDTVPAAVIVVAAGTAAGAAPSHPRLPFALQRLSSLERSAAKQRNLGAQEVRTEWLVFCDDDVRFAPDLAGRVLAFLGKHPEAVAVSPRMAGASHPVPGPLLRKYYGLQAGYDHETFGGKLFGPGISCYPCWERQSGPVEAEWLPSTMLWMKTEIFRRHLFPEFEGYSFGEDAHLTHRVWRDAAGSAGRLFFLGSPEFEHRSIQSGVKSARFHLARMTITNQRLIAREAQGKTRWEIFWKSLLHRVFVSAALVKSRRTGWIGELAGLWTP